MGERISGVDGGVMLYQVWYRVPRLQADYYEEEKRSIRRKEEEEKQR